MAARKIGTSTLAFDCEDTTGHPTAINIRSIEPCILSNKPNEITTKLGQIIQQKQVDLIDVFSCRIKITSKIFVCGIFSLNFLVHQGFWANILQITKETCNTLIENGTFTYHGKTINNIPRNTLFHTSKEIFGSISDSGACAGEDFQIKEGTFKKSVYVANIEILTSKLVTNK